jgi:type II pantothenate kinase
MNAEKYGLKRIYFGGCFIRGLYNLLSTRVSPTNLLFLTGHATTIATLSYAIRFWSKGSMRAMFLRHEGFLYVFYLFLLLILVEHISHFQRIDWSMDQEYRPEQHYVPLFTNRLLIANHI